jgi:diguanylate cyclase (GGDEF)-like protein
MNTMMRRSRYAVAGGLLGLGAPVGLLCVRLIRNGFSLRSVSREIVTDQETYIYSAASTTVGFALFGGVIGHYGDRLAKLAATDSLTGLANRRAFQERLRHELGRVARYQEALSLFIIDVDGLKRVNDEYGHAVGDDALRSVAAAIRQELREVDLGARLGGDEFGVLAPRTSKQSARVLAERLRARVARGITAPSSGGTTISIGIASLAPSKDERPTAASLMAAADEALYLAKGEGRNRVSDGHSLATTKAGDTAVSTGLNPAASIIRPPSGGGEPLSRARRRLTFLRCC